MNPAMSMQNKAATHGGATIHHDRSYAANKPSTTNTTASVATIRSYTHRGGYGYGREDDGSDHDDSGDHRHDHPGHGVAPVTTLLWIGLVIVAFVIGVGCR